MLTDILWTLAYELEKVNQKIMKILDNTSNYNEQRDLILTLVVENNEHRKRVEAIRLELEDEDG